MADAGNTDGHEFSFSIPSSTAKTFVEHFGLIDSKSVYFKTKI